MVNPNGKRRGTRYMFARPFRGHGMPGMSTYLKTYKRGEYVTLMGNGAIQKGMPHKYYHGKTGQIFNISPHGVGVEINKRVGNRMIKKHVTVRVEHVKKSNCHKAHEKRMKRNRLLRREAVKKGVKVYLKRQPLGPKPGHVVSTKNNKPVLLEPIKYEFIV